MNGVSCDKEIFYGEDQQGNIGRGKCSDYAR